MNNIKARLRKLEADQIDYVAWLDSVIGAWLDSLTDDEMDAVSRDNARHFRSGEASPQEIEYFTITAKLDEEGGFDAWLQSVKPPQLGDDELVRNAWDKFEKCRALALRRRLF